MMTFNLIYDDTDIELNSKQHRVRFVYDPTWHLLITWNPNYK